MSILFGSVLNEADKALRWDGWRAIAALGTAAAVWVALTRDRRADKRNAIKESHVIAAIISNSEGVLALARDYENGRTKPAALRRILDIYDSTPAVSVTSSILSGLKMTDLPSVEVMTTCAAIQTIHGSIDNAFNKARLCLVESDGKSSPPSIEANLEILEVSLDDLRSELKLAAGPFYEVATQEGHRKRAIAKLHGSPRSRAFRTIPKLLRAIATNRAQDS